MKDCRTGVAFLYDRPRRSVLLQLRDDKSGILNPNVWALPGGGMEPEDTSVLEAARRELHEEAGYLADDLQYMGRDEELIGAETWQRHYFAVPYDGIQPIIKGEGQRMEFISVDALPASIIPAHREWIRKMAGQLDASPLP